MLTLVNNSKEKMPRQFVKSWLDSIYSEIDRLNGSALRLKDLELTVVFLDSAAAKKINQSFRKKNYATDILSFAGDLEESLGELVICPQVLKKQAKEHKLSFSEELGYMLIHGVLHLMGFDHEKTKKEAKVMMGIQDQLFDKLCKKFF